MNKLILISGLPGSGKSTIAENLARNLHIPIFSVDPIESSIIKAGISKSFETGLSAYIVAETLAIEHLNLGINVIIDAVNSVKEARDMWYELSKNFKTKLFIVECTLDEKIHKERIESRIRNMYGMPEVTWNDVEKQRKEYLVWEKEKLVIDTTDSIEHNINKIIHYINN